MNDKFDYFIDQANKRFDKIDQKLEELISFRLMLLGGAAVVSTIVSLVIMIILK